MHSSKHVLSNSWTVPSLRINRQVYIVVPWCYIIKSAVVQRIAILTELNHSRLSISSEVMQRLLSIVWCPGFINLHASCHQNCRGWKTKQPLKEVWLTTSCITTWILCKHWREKAAVWRHLSYSTACSLCLLWRSSCLPVQRWVLPALGTGTNGQTKVLL